MKLLFVLFFSMFSVVSLAADSVRLIVPFPVGGGGDKLGRLLEKELKETKNIDVIIENRPGANTKIGTAVVSRIKSKEVVLLLSINSMATFANEVGNEFDITKDLKPVAYLGSQPLILAAHPSLGIKNLSGLRTYSKKIDFATSGIGTPIYSNSEDLVKRLNLDATLINHKGMGEYLVPVLANHMQIGFFAPSIIESHVQVGSLVPLAVTGKTRLSNWKNLLTFEEQGLHDFGNDLWYILMVNATADPKIVKEIQDVLVKLLSTKLSSDKFRKIDVYPDPQLTLQGASLLAREIQKYNKK